MESVDCQECGQRYDSEQNAFCPRCGSEGKAPAAAPTLQAADKRDPSRRRAQIGGVVLLVMGLVSAILYASVAFTASTLVPQFSEELLGDQPGGSIVVSVFDDGTPLAGVNVTLTSLPGAHIANGTTDADGVVTLSTPDHAAVNITIQGDQTFQRKALALEGSSTKVRVDVATDDTATGDWAGLGTLVGAMQGLLAFFIAMSLFVAFAGFAALRLRWKGVATGGAVIGMVPGLIMAVAIPNVGSLLILGIMGMALAFIVMGRHHFA